MDAPHHEAQSFGALAHLVRNHWTLLCMPTCRHGAPVVYCDGGMTLKAIPQMSFGEAQITSN